MRLLNSYMANIKRLFKSPKIWGPFVLMPAFMFLLFFFILNGGGDNTATYGLVIEDKGTRWEEVVDLFGDRPIILSREEAEEELKSYNIKLVYVLDEDFTRDIEDSIKPNITKLFIEDSGYQMKDSLLNERIVSMMKDSYLEKKNISLENEADFELNIELINKKTDMDFTFNLIVLTTSYIIVLLSGGIGNDLIQISRSKVLSRVLTSPNSNIENIGGIFLSYLTFLAVVFNLMTLLGYGLLDIEISNLAYIVLSVTAMSAYSLSLIILIVRYSQDENILSIVPMVLSILMFLSQVFYSMNKASLPAIAGKIIFINPLFWVQKTMETANILNILPVFLMTMVLLTFGSYKLENLQNI